MITRKEMLKAVDIVARANEKQDKFGFAVCIAQRLSDDTRNFMTFYVHDNEKGGILADHRICYDDSEVIAFVEQIVKRVKENDTV